jgi:predicted nucleic acid-binding protein
MIHFDTSFLIHALAPASRPDRRLRRWLRDGETFAISAVAWTEFLRGPVQDQADAIGAMFEEIVPYTVADGEVAARLFDLGGRRRGTLADCMIAATAIRAGAPLATTNARDFERFASESLTVLAT